MNIISPFASRNPVMETIMKTPNPLKRAGRWLAALGMLMFSGAAANAQAGDLPRPGVTLSPEIVEKLEREVRPGVHRPEVFFTKTGKQVGCDYVKYSIRFGIKGDAGYMNDPDFKALLQTISFRFDDQMPAGLRAESASLSGDVPAGPAVLIHEVADVDDTVTIETFGLSPDDLDGSGDEGGLVSRSVDIEIWARIDPGHFAAPAMTINQAGITAKRGDMEKIFVSHDPALPDDGNDETGEKTKVFVDLTGCEKTPPGGGTPEACFKLVEGEVLCDQDGGGDFIYKMPVGPEMAGQTVELSSLSPWVSINPPSQIVPAGGGVLEWTISGASPGDTIQLVVTGTNFASGPKEGLGLCCTQRIDIKIPDNLDCPDRPRRPDLVVEKRANQEVCKREGPCNFTIRVTNGGGAPYNGPIVLDEVTAPGNAAIMAGPNAPWACVPGISPLTCTHPATTLNPGQFVELKLGFKPGPGWSWGAIRNCAALDYPGMGKLPFGNLSNDKACASIPICQRGDPRCDEKKTDLMIRKLALSEYCSADGVCGFKVGIRNVGTTTHNGPLSFTDTVSPPAPTSMMFAPTPPWACVMLNPSSYRCDHPGMVLTPGAFTVIAVRVIAPNYQKDTLENCVDLKQIPNETNLANNKSCATIKIRQRDAGNPDLGIFKECRTTRLAAAAGMATQCRIRVNNTGTGAPAGIVRVSDVSEMIGGGAPVQIMSVAPDGPEWNCGPTPANSLICDLPGAALPPGAERSFIVTVADTNNEPARNCAKGSVGVGDAFAPFGEACVPFGGTVRVTKTGDLSCQAGGICNFAITITNGTGGPINGPVHVIDAMTINGAPSNAAITSINPPLGCAPEPGALPINCVANMVLAPGESRTHQIAVQLPADAGNGDNANGRNCVAMEPGAPNGLAGAMPKAAVIGQPDLPPNVACHLFRVAAQQAVCTPPLVANADGRCVCPDGMDFKNGKCVESGVNPKPIVCSIPGQVVVNGDCVCPRGQQVINGRCRVPPIVCTVPGQVVSDGKCVCPRGQQVINGR
ncbi:MAG: hypothetical protein WAT78_09245, partial [Rhizobiaceae bacterium]